MGKYTTLHVQGKKILEKKDHKSFGDADEHARDIANFHKTAYDNTDYDHDQSIGKKNKSANIQSYCGG